MKLPIDFEQFSKDPVKGLLFIVIAAVGYLYVDNKMNYQDQIENCGNDVQKLNKKIDVLENRLHKSDSTLVAAWVRLEVLNNMK